jgi:lia operon protein LiaG
MRAPTLLIPRSVALVAAIAASAGAQTPERHSLSGGTVAVYNVAGKVRLVAGTGSAVVVDVSRGGSDGRELRVEKGELRGRETLRVIYPDDRIVYPGMGRRSSTRTRIRDDGTFGDSGDGGDRGFSGRQIEIRGDGRGVEAWADLTIAVPRGQKLALHLLVGEANVVNVDGDLLIDVASAEVTAERTRGRLVVDAGSGRVRVDGAEGDLLIDTGSGATEVRGARGREVRVDAGSGSVTLDDVDAPTVDVDVGSGRARLSGIRARDLRLDSGSGSVDVGLVADVESVRIDTGSGSVTLRVPESLGAELDVDSGSGGVSTDIPITVTRRQRDRLVGRIGDGRGRIVIDAGSGGVRIVRS